MNLGDLIDQLKISRDNVRAIKKSLDEAQDNYKALEQKVLNELTKQGVTNSRSKLAIATVTQQTVASVEDWEAFMDYVIREDARHLLQRRIASRAALEEMEENGQPLPGVTTTSLTALGLRSL